METLASLSAGQTRKNIVAPVHHPVEVDTVAPTVEPPPVEQVIPSHPNAARLRGGLYGLLVGDALGVPYEFDRPHNLPAYDLIEMEPPGGYQRSHYGVRPGTWSDDGAQALALLECLTENRALDLEAFAALLLRWFYEGYLTPDDRVFDVGGQTRRALESLKKGVPAGQMGPASASENGNGALMRVLPVAFLGLDAYQTGELAMRQSTVTHGHIRSQLCCALYAVLATEMLKGTGLPEALEFTESHLRQQWASTPHAEELQLVLDGRNDKPRGSGYVVNSLWSAVHSVQVTDSYEAAVKTAILLGDDTDTTACLAGGLAGILYGVDAIPARWMSTLRGKPMVEAAWKKFSDKAVLEGLT
jgi:ADP-ribosyl-[dinitrogen reductase] hydrolase